MVGPDQRPNNPPNLTPPEEFAVPTLVFSRSGVDPLILNEQFFGAELGIELPDEFVEAVTEHVLDVFNHPDSRGILFRKFDDDPSLVGVMWIVDDWRNPPAGFVDSMGKSHTRLNEELQAKQSRMRTGGFFGSCNGDFDEMVRGLLVKGAGKDIMGAMKFTD